MKSVNNIFNKPLSFTLTPSDYIERMLRFSNRFITYTSRKEEVYVWKCKGVIVMIFDEKLGKLHISSKRKPHILKEKFYLTNRELKDLYSSVLFEYYSIKINIVITYI